MPAPTGLNKKDYDVSIPQKSGNFKRLFECALFRGFGLEPII